ncbi:GNAT family N-acetyltransferase [Montanilutibacter psychrotolerans]|uniref:GNAT family N-acetyltransferase n=1 Tax=Montanilutibacter psychrotolerans TaxID=1327343 RepID=A0A3M8SQI2_9GAMM|nr:GNAT family N-acetyltransferase [Lysobacter psychrotolerans]RNF83588.1 GNAT family N-acetyltransferase [Lysobacter psychrotolerans]
MRLDRRPASEGDIPFLLSLRRETMDGHLMASGGSTTEEAHLARLMYHFDCAEVLTRNGHPVGLLKLQRFPDEWQIIQIQLSRDFQGQGIGRALLEELLADAAAAGADVSLGVLKANPARRLYERLGFEVVGEDALEYRMRHFT